MAEPDWAEVLHELHKGQMAAPDTWYVADYLMEGTELTDEDIEWAIKYLDNAGLIEGEASLNDEKELVEVEAALTPQGFKVAHERELAKRQDRTNTTLVGFTLALVLASLVAVLPTTWTFFGYAIPLRLVGAFVLLVVVVGYILHTDLHEDLLDL